jgi:pimeloyl-ACP methyl ester carboxylesterase
MRIAPLLLAALAWGCAPGEAPPVRIALSDCRLPGVEAPARCGTHEVFEDRASGTGRRIGIKVAVIPAKRRARDPDPIVVLAGGPGQGAIALAPQVVPLFARLGETRDLVLVDQRGTGDSNPLACEGDEGHGLQSIFEDTVPEKLVRDCLAKLDADPRHYATPAAIADLDEVLGALGYTQVNLWGGSYGTRAALEFVRRHPGRVRTATLDGAAPATMMLPLSFVADGEAAYERLLADCEGDAACRRAYPGLRSQAKSLREKLARRPMQAEIADPVTGETLGVKVTQNVLLSGIFRPLYSPELSSLLPYAIDRAAGGDFNPLLAQNLEFSGELAENLAIGMHLSVVCSEDVPRIGAEDLAAATRSFFGRALVDDFLRACAIWPRATLPPDFGEPVKSDVPVLILSGGLDPATPPRHGELVASTLTRSRHLVAPHLSHGVSGHGCAPRLIEKFVKAGDASDLDGGCLARLPRPLFLLPAGSRP